MKRLFAALLCMIMMGAMFVFPIMADEITWEEDFEHEIGNVPCPNATPTVDGNIASGEGWSSAVYYDKTNVDGGWGGEPVDVSGNLYSAYDDTYFYIAAEIAIPELGICEGEDWIEDGTTVGDLPGWDGDVFVLSMDPLQELLWAGFANDPAPWYCFGIFEGGEVRTYRTHVNDMEISDIVSAAGAITADGWRFEAAIPWETICEDIATISYGDVELTPEDILVKDNKVSAAMIYYDRRHDPEAEERITYSRYVSIATTLPDGTPGIMATPWKLQAHGIYFIIGEPKSEQGPVTDDPATDTTAKPNDQPGNDTTASTGENNTQNGNNDSAQNNATGTDKATDNSGSKTTTNKNAAVTTKKQNSSSVTGSDAAQTLDIGIAVALGALAASAIGIGVTKKRR